MNEVEQIACQRLLAMAIEEDLSTQGDITSKAVIQADLQGRAALVARCAGVVAGLPAAALVFGTVDARVEFRALVQDGQRIQPGDKLATVRGPMRGILAAERIALNFLQHLSGIASLTRRYVDAVAGLRGQILDTRKTLPGWRLLAKYAVRCGGGHNHRLGLFDGILIKDNHLAALATAEKQKIAEALRLAQAAAKPNLPVEIEVDTLDQLESALPCRPDIVLLDNMTCEQLRAAVRRRDESAPGVLLEASGGVNLGTVRGIAETGVDRISVGALTHSAPALDIALDYET